MTSSFIFSMENNFPQIRDDGSWLFKPNFKLYSIKMNFFNYSMASEEYQVGASDKKSSMVRVLDASPSYFCIKPVL